MRYSLSIKAVINYIAGIADFNLINNKSQIREDVCSLFYKGDIKSAITKKFKKKIQHLSIILYLIQSVIT